MSANEMKLDVGIVVRDVDDIEACVGRCAAAGAKVTMPVREGRTPGIRIAMVEDPEGNTVEFIDRSGVA